MTAAREPAADMWREAIGGTWRAVPGWERYEVSTSGQIRRAGRVLKGLAMGYGYRGIILCGDGRQIRRYIHDLVLTTFVGPRPDGHYACHGNGIRDDNRLSNLRWDTPSNNNLDQLRHKTNLEANKTNCPLGHALALPNLVASELLRGHRKCRACSQARAVAQRRQIDIAAEANARYALIMEAAA